MATPYDSEPVDRLPFGSAEKSARYATERYLGATGLNWWRCDPTLQFLMRYYLTADELAWAEPHLDRIGALMGGPVSERAEITDKNPPRLERYDRWGHDVSEVILPPSFLETRRDVLASGFVGTDVAREAASKGVRTTMLHAAHSYMLDQAEIGMMCAIGTGGDMVVNLVRAFAPEDIKQRVMEKFASGEWAGQTIQSLTERTGGSDLAELETTATPDGDAWRLNGFKWFASNVNGEAWVVLAKPEGAPDSARGIATYLVLKERRDGSRNGIRIRRLKDKLGTKAVASGEVEFVDAEAFLLSGQPSGADGETGAGDGKGLARMMEMTNGARLGIAMMGLGCARRSLVEALCYARARTAFGKPLAEHPLMQRKLAELIVDVEAAQAMVFDGYDPDHRLRIGAPLIKLRAARLGITASSDAIEVHGGNGYVENWPVARILRDAQVNTLWEGPDNILCLDVRRGIERQQADVAFVDRLRSAVGNGPSDEVTALVGDRVDDLVAAIDKWKGLDRVTAEARLFPLAQFMADVYAGALLLEQAGFEQRELGSDRKSLVARLYAKRHLADPGPLRGIDDPATEDLERFKDLLDGALVDDRVV